MLCECGCGEDAGVYRKQAVRGQPRQFIHGHNRRRPRCEPAEKTCSACGVTKSAGEFYCDAAKTDGLSSRCRECVKARARQQYIDDPLGHAERQRAWRATNPGRQGFLARRWYWRNLDRARLIGREKEDRRRARQAAQYVEDVEPQTLWEMYGGVCGICAELVEPHEMERDHVIPLSRGGEHSYANMRPAHRSCNRRKGQKLLSEMEVRA